MKDPKDKTEEEPSACETKQVGDIGKEPGKTPAELEDDDLESVSAETVDLLGARQTTRKIMQEEPAMNEQKKESRNDRSELNENDLEKVDGGMRVVVGNGKMGTCEKCGTYGYLVDGYCEKCRKNK